MALSELLVALTWECVLGCCVLFIIAGFVADFATLPRYPAEIAVLGYGCGIWAHLRNSVAYFSNHQSWVKEGYVKYSKKGLPFIVPAAISRPSDVVLPRSLVAWFIDQPDSILGAHESHNNIVYGDYNFLNRKLARDSFGVRAFHKFMARSLPGLIPAIDAEVQLACEQALGHVAEGWASVNLWDLWMTVVPRVTNRIIVGGGVCRDKQYLEGVVNFTDAVIRNCILLRMCPQALHPIFGHLLAIPNRLYWRSAHKRVAPVIEKRLDDMMRHTRGDLRYKDWVPPEDFITWLIRLAIKENRQEELDPVVISLRLLPLEFASIHTSVVTGHSWFLDLLSMPREKAILDLLSDEVRTHKPASGVWSKSALQSLVAVDSSIRESQRVSNFHTTLVERVVVAPQGLRHPDFGWTLPKGIYVTVNLDGTHHDENLFKRARTYDPLRYARIRARWENKSAEERDASKEGRTARGLGMVTTSDQHFAFGHGRHACPGRFFVAYEFKLIMANLLLNYDMRSVDERPQPKWFGSTIIPPLQARIEIRRKQAPASPCSRP